jgi:transposase
VSEPTSCCRATGVGNAYCDNCDLLLGLDGLRVLEVERAADLLTVTVESAPGLVGCSGCGVVAQSHGRRVVRLVDAPCFTTPVVLLWRKRRYRCREDACEVGTFTEQDPDLARPRGLLTTRAARWAIGQIRREHASVQGVARQLGVRWRTVWEAIKPFWPPQPPTRPASPAWPPSGRRAHLAPRLHQADAGRRPRAEGADRHGRPDRR